MKALSIRQPWAWLILHAGKDIENRTWQTNFRGRVLIHAAKGMTAGEFDDAMEFAGMVTDGFSTCGTDRLPTLHDIERGGIVGSVEIVDCVQRNGRRNYQVSDWFVGPWGFVLRNPEPLPFRPLKGALGFFDVQE